MTGMFGQKALLGQANGPDVELRVTGTSESASYETEDGLAAVYDETLGMFCYARVEAGAPLSTGVSVLLPPPPELKSKKESIRVRN